MSRVRLYDSGMNEIVLRGVRWLEFNPAPVEANKVTEKVGNREITLGKTTEPRLIEAKMWFTSADPLDFALLRNEIYRLLSPLKDMWAVDSKVPGVKWWVSVESLSKPKRINGKTAECDVVFKSPTCYARSIGDSLDPFTFDSGLWGYGMGLLEDASAQDYSHSTTSFTIYNPSDVMIDPREHELRIMLYYNGAPTSSISIRNNTTGDLWKLDAQLYGDDIITIDGVVTELNTVNAVGKTNFGLIRLREGYNNIQIIGTSGNFDIFFKFPFLYV